MTCGGGSMESVWHPPADADKYSRATALILDSDTVISAHSDRTLKAWNRVDGVYQGILGEHNGVISCLAILPSPLGAWASSSGMPAKVR